MPEGSWRKEPVAFSANRIPSANWKKRSALFSVETFILSEELTDILLNTSQANLRKNPIDLLSDRELEVVEYYAIGMGTKEIAQKMNLDMTTISTFRRRAFEKMDVQNAIELKRSSCCINHRQVDSMLQPDANEESASNN